MKTLLLLFMFIPFWVFGAPKVDPEHIMADLAATLADIKPVKMGEVYENEIKGQDPDDFGIAVTHVNGTTYAVGTVEVGLPIMSISKVFAYAVAIEQNGLEFIVRQVGQDATGRPFDDLETYRFNPYVNTGAIAVHSYIDDISSVLDLYSNLAGSPVRLNEEWRAIPMPITTATAWLVKSKGRLAGVPSEATTAYLEACIAEVTLLQLARMGAVLANDGVDLETDERFLESGTVRQALSISVTAGMYEDSGAWFAETGLPSKSGVSGAVLAVVPGWGAIAAYSPRLDEAGNSVRGTLAIKSLARKWGLHSMERLLSD